MFKDKKNKAAQELGRLGGLARAKKYSKKKLKEFAKDAGRPKTNGKNKNNISKD